MLFENSVKLGVVLRKIGKAENEVIGNSKMREVMEGKTFPCFIYGDFMEGDTVVSSYQPVQDGEKGGREVLGRVERLLRLLLLLLLLLQVR